jgi:hypothetical protein
MEPWYKLTTAEIRRKGGHGLLKYHNGSVSKILEAVFPEFKWDISKFVRKPRNYWSSTEKQREFVEGLGLKLGFRKENLEGWYNVTNNAFIGVGGGTLLSIHSFSLPSLLESIYVEHNWVRSKFSKRSQGHWNSIENQKESLRNIGMKLGITNGNLDGWYRVTVEDFAKHDAWGLISLYNGSPSSLLMAVFPEHKWDPFRFAHSKMKARNTDSVGSRVN